MAPKRSQHATFRYYGPLNDFLPPHQRQQPLRHNFELPASLKDICESMGVPHPEIELLLRNGQAVSFGELVRDGDLISVYPAFGALDLGTLRHFRPQLREHRFLLDSHLGRLARYLRLLGLDAMYKSNNEDEELAQTSHRQERVLLTRDCGLLKRSEVIYGYFVRATEVKQQAVEVLRRFDLYGAVAPFTRCLRCNSLLEPVAKESIVERLQPRTRQHYEEFRLCPSCHRIYWPGPHYRKMSDLVREILEQQQLATARES